MSITPEFCFNIGRLFTATTVLFVGVLVTELGGYSNSLFIFSLVFLGGLAVTFFTKNDMPVKKSRKQNIPASTPAGFSSEFTTKN